MAQELTAHIILKECLSSVPSTILSSSQVPVKSTPGEQGFRPLWVPTLMCTDPHTYIQF